MASGITFSGARQFTGMIWNLLVSPSGSHLLIESRNPETRQVLFSIWNLRDDRWTWSDVALEESWWVSAAALPGDIVLFTLYTETNNPVDKALLAYQVNDKTLAWWQNDFSLASVSATNVTGFSHKFGLQELTLDLVNGKVMRDSNKTVPLQNFPVLKPFHYKEGEKSFDTVQAFLNGKAGVTAELAADYLEADGLVFISYYTREKDLANYLIVLDGNGVILLHEKAAENLKGIGTDTFFILEGSLIFVKNKSELVRYKLL